MDTSAQRELRLRDHRPEPSNLWIRHSAIWPGPADLVWVDLARGSLGGVDPQRAGAGHPLDEPGDLVYLPPAAYETDRERLRDWCTEHEVPTLVQYPANDAASGALHEGRSLVVDLLATLLTSDLDVMAELPPECLVAWPMATGLTDSEVTIAAGLDRLVRSGVGHVLPVPLHLSPRARRRLSETFGDQHFDSLFHSREGSARPFARACRERGLAYLAPRPPLVGAPAFERALSTELSLIGELWSGIGDSPAIAQEFFRAASWVESTRHDVAAMAREGNLGVVPSLSTRVVEVITELAEGDAERSSLLESLDSRYAS